MKLLLCVGNYKEFFDANVKIALELTRELVRLGNECQIVFVDDTSRLIKNGVYNEIPFIRVPSSKWAALVNNHYNEAKRKGISKAVYAIEHPVRALIYYYFKNGDKYSYKEYKTYVNKLVQSNNIDYVISFSNPFYPTFSIANTVSIDKFIYYQCDPFGLHELQNRNNKSTRIQQEIRVIHNSSFVFTTNSLYEQYKNHPKYSSYIYKMIPVCFPNLNTQYYMTNYLTKRKYEIYFLGSIDDSYRDPEKIIDFIMSSKLPTRIHFYGNIQSKSLNKAIKKYTDRVTYNSQIDNNEALRLINSNVYLLNINNSISNQSPSKLIDYIATGNPIINCVKLPSDTSPVILSNYGLSFHFYEYKENNIDEFDSFIIKSLNSKVKKSTIQKEYYEYTPSYVARIIHDKLTKK